MATQLHFLDLTLSSEGFVEISSALMAASKSEMAVEAPAMGIPPEMDTLVLLAEGFGVEVRETGFDFDLGFEGPSPMR